MTNRYMITRTTNGGYLVEEYGNERSDRMGFDGRTGIVFAYSNSADAIDGVTRLIKADDDADSAPVPPTDDRAPMFAEPGDDDRAPTTVRVQPEPPPAIGGGGSAGSGKMPLADYLGPRGDDE